MRPQYNADLPRTKYPYYGEGEGGREEMPIRIGSWEQAGAKNEASWLLDRSGKDALCEGAYADAPVVVASQPGRALLRRDRLTVP